MPKRTTLLLEHLGSPNNVEVGQFVTNPEYPAIGAYTPKEVLSHTEPKDYTIITG